MSFFRSLNLRGLDGFCDATFLCGVARLLPLKTTAGFLLVAVGFLSAGMRRAFKSRKSRRIVVSVTFSSCAIKRRDLPALIPAAINLRRSEILREFLSEPV
jgi:hypothetical protein